MDEETVFIPSFIKELPPKGKRTKAYPKEQAELIVAAVQRFNTEGHSVLLYCPMRKSVEPTAESFLLMANWTAPV